MDLVLTIQYKYDYQSITFSGTEIRGEAIRLAAPGVAGFFEQNHDIRMSYIDILVLNLEQDIPTNVAMRINGSLLYWDGTQWVPSDGTLAQSNLVSDLGQPEWNELLEGPSEVSYRIFLNPEGDVDPVLPSIEWQYSNIEPSPVIVERTEVYGYVEDLDGSPIASAAIKVSLKDARNKYVEANGRLVSCEQVVTTDANGYWSMSLVPSSQYENNIFSTYILQITLPNGKSIRQNGSSKIEFVVGDSLDQVNITDLIVSQ